jgi:hypothetical protein
MNFIQKFFGAKSGVLSARLKDAGFTTEQASIFLPEAASSILNAFEHKEIERIIAALEIDEPKKLLHAINVNAMANNIGMTPTQVTSGFEVIMPVMAKAFKKHSGGIIGAAASIAWGSTGDFYKVAK